MKLCWVKHGKWHDHNNMAIRLPKFLRVVSPSGCFSPWIDWWKNECLRAGRL